MHESIRTIENTAPYDNDPVYAAIERHRRIHSAYVEDLNQYADGETADAGERLAEREAEARATIIECPASTRAGIEAAIHYVAELQNSGWELLSDVDNEFGAAYSERRFIAACSAALDRLDGRRCHGRN